MKKLIAIVLVLVTLLSATPFAQAETLSYITWAFSSLDFVDEIKDRLLLLAEKEEPAPIEVELAFQYADMYVRLMVLSTVELKAATQTDAPEENDSLKKSVELLEQMRLFHDLGIVSGTEAIKAIADGLVGD